MRHIQASSKFEDRTVRRNRKFIVPRENAMKIIGKLVIDESYKKKKKKRKMEEEKRKKGRESKMLFLYYFFPVR